MVTEFLESSEIASYYNGMVREARGEIILVTPWFQPFGHLLRNLNYALKRGVRLKIATRPPEENKQHRKRVEEFQNKKQNLPKVTKKMGLLKREEVDPIEFIFIPHLHAKMLMTDNKSLLISSANVLETSFHRNIELGIFSDDHDVINSAGGFIYMLEEMFPSEPESRLKKKKEVSRHKCEFCGKVIKNPNHKLCWECYKKSNLESKPSITDPTKCPMCGGRKNPGYELCYSCDTKRKQTLK